MGDEEGITKGGSRIIRHEERDREWVPPNPEQSVAEEVESHFASIGLEPQTVFHEIASDIVHVDVHVCMPYEDRPFYTLFTTGMSDLPMNAPEGAEGFERAEVMLCLPPSWPMDDQSLDYHSSYWPAGLLKFVARFPHEYECWLGWGHTIPNGDPPEPFADDTAMCGLLLASPLTIPEHAHSFESSRGPVHIYSVLPLHEAEMQLKLEKGTEHLLDRFDDHRVSEILDPFRKPVTRRKLFGIF